MEKYGKKETSLKIDGLSDKRQSDGRKDSARKRKVLRGKRKKVGEKSLSLDEENRRRRRKTRLGTRAARFFVVQHTKTETNTHK
jgi:hypothetical protein